jgi:hypothetical protein
MPHGVGRHSMRRRFVGLVIRSASRPATVGRAFFWRGRYATSPARPPRRYRRGATQVCFDKINSHHDWRAYTRNVTRAAIGGRSVGRFKSRARNCLYLLLVARGLRPSVL